MKRMARKLAQSLSHTLVASLLGAALLAPAGGCTHAVKPTANAAGIFQRATEHDSSGGEYVIDPPDEVVFKAPNIKEIDGVKQVVRADGKISLNLLGEVKVSGQSPRAVQEMLIKIASKYYTNPDIKVEVTANSKFYMVFGRGANIQKKIPYTGNDNVVKAVAEVGTSDHFWPEQVILVRPGAQGREPARAVVDFKHLTMTGDFSQNYAIQQGDILTLPDSPLSYFQFKTEQIFGPVTGAGAVRAAASPTGGNGL